MSSTAATVAAFACLIGIALLCALPASAEVSVSVTADDAEPVSDCAGAGLKLDATKPLPPCVVFATAKGARIRVEYRPGAQVAGTSAATRVVYAKSSKGKLGAKLGTLTVGSVAKPLGYFCDPTDTITSGATVYALITDSAVPASLRGYVSGCAA